MSDREEQPEQADWIGEDDSPGNGELWRRHLYRQQNRTLVAILVLLFILGLRSAGRPGRWVLRQLGRATTAETGGPIAHPLTAFRFRDVLATMRKWLTHEWQVTGPELSQTPADVPLLFWPIKGGRLLPPDRAQSAGGPGLDLQVAAGTPVHATAAGTVAESRLEADDSWTVILRHPDDWRTVYGRCQAALVKPGEKVTVGQTIALVGSAPPPIPAHLHFELWGPHGQTDPGPYLPPEDTIGNGPR